MGTKWGIFFEIVVLLALAGATRNDLLTPVQTIPLESVHGRIDHMALDAPRQRLYVAALGNNSVEVVDLAAGKRIASISGPRKPQGVCVLPEDGTLVVASGDDGKVRFYDTDQKLLGTVGGLDDADNVRYDATARRLYVGYGDGALAILDPQRFAKLGEIKLQAHAESFQLETHGPRIFVNVPEARQVAVVDRVQQKVIATWQLDQQRANYPMALDEAGHRLLIACRQPAALVVLDTDTGHAVAQVPCVGDADDVFFDPARKCVYITGGEGAVSVIAQRTPEEYVSFSSQATAIGARTSLLSPDGQRLWVAIPLHGEQRPELRCFTPQLPAREHP